MNFRKILTEIDVAPLLAQLRNNPDLWSTDTEWTRKKSGSAIYKTENIVLRYLTLGLDSDRGLYLYERDRDRDHWTRPAFSTFSAAQPIVFDLMRAVLGEHLGHVIITRLPPGGTIEPHVDQWPAILWPPYWQRFQVPLAVSPDCRFECGGETLWMEPGCAYWFDNKMRHAVYNGASERISMLIDIRPFGPN